jgi:glycosyltransferase involved in cell wall biosynthesis
MSAMRILFCNKYSFRFSGTEAYLFDVMELLRAKGHEVALFSMAAEDAKGCDPYQVPYLNFKQRGWWGRARLATPAIYSTDARRRLRKLIADFKPDVAHVRNIYHHLSPSILWELRRQEVPVLYHVNDFKMICPSYNLVRHGRACDLCGNGKFWHVLSSGCYEGCMSARAVLAAEAYVHKWFRTYVKCVDRFLAPSLFVREKLVENGWDKNLIEVIPHFQSLPARVATRPSPTAGALYFGRLSAEKGLIDLLHAMTWHPEISLQIAGEGPQRVELERLSADLELANVSFLGQVEGENLQRLIAGARFTVLPSHAYETLGKTILESFAQARPVIATDLGSRRELIEEGKTGLLYAPGNIGDLAETMSFLYSQPGLAAAMGEAAQEKIRERYSPEQHYSELLRLYEQLVVKRKKVTPASGQAEPRPLRVAFIGGRGVISKYSGIESYYEEVGAGLAQRGHELTIYCRSYFTPAVGCYRGMKLLRLPTIRTKHLETVMHTALSTMHAMLGHSDIVHYHALGPALFSFLPRLLGKKTVVTVQGLDWQRKKWGKAAAGVLRLGEMASCRFASSTMVVSRTLQDYYVAQHGAETIYIPNGTRIRERCPLHHYLPRWRIEPDNYILFLGRFSPEKNCDLLMRAYSRIETPVKLVLGGGSSHSDGYAAELRRRQSQGTVLLSWVSGEALDELITNAMIFVLPSDLEGLSLALLDAMGAGVCVLASDVPENRELVDGAGFTFRTRDEVDLERMLRLLIADPEIRMAAGHAARERVRKQYLWPQITEQIEQEYFNVLGWPGKNGYHELTSKAVGEPEGVGRS